MKFEFMKNHANEFKIGKMALVLQVSRKGYYKHLRRNQAKKIINARLLRIIRVIYILTVVCSIPAMSSEILRKNVA